MQSVVMSSSEGAIDAIGHTISHTPAPVTAGWLLRRMALWFVFVALGVAGACLLYTAASKAEAESLARKAPSPVVAHAVKG
jgi:hypothetical protein